MDDAVTGGGQVFQVKAILGKRKLRGKVEYKVRWLGYEDPKEDTWELETNMHCPDMVKEFNERQYKLKLEGVQKDKGKKVAGGTQSQQQLRTRPPVAGRQHWEPPTSPDHKYKVEEGKAVSAILGVEKHAELGTVVALVLYEDDSDGVQYELVPTEVLTKYAEANKLLVCFYEARLTFY